MSLEDIRYRKTGGPLSAEVNIAVVRMLRGRVFRVNARWEPREDDVAIRSDAYDTDRIELAREIAGEAWDQLRAGGEPDLRAIATWRKRRDPSLATAVRELNGARTAGDTVPDERPNQP